MEREKIRICPNCKQEVKIVTGLQNWKKLFRRPTLDDFITLFIILCVIGLFFAYQHDIKQYQDYIANNCDKGITPLIDINRPINQSELNQSIKSNGEETEQ
jgi:hypothetical protein